MLGVYLLGIVGIDVHSCLSSGKSFVVSLWGGIECNDIHPESDCASLCCSHCHHAHSACSDKACTQEGVCSSVNDDCCSDSCHYLALTGATTDHDELLSQIVRPEIDLFSTLTPAIDVCEAKTFGHILTPPDSGLSSPDILALISSYRI